MKKPNIPKKEQSLYKETARLRVMEILFRFPEKEFSLTEIARQAHVAKSNIGKILRELKEEEFIEITDLRITWRIRASQQNQAFIKNKIVYNLSTLYQSGLVEFLEKYFNFPKSIILFGSFRKGEDISTSDIDIAVEKEDEKYRLLEDLKEIEEFERFIGKKIQIHLFSRKRTNPNVFGNIANGIILSGFLEARQ